MKKIILVLMALVLAAPFATTASAQSMTKTQKVINKQLQKALKKEYKEKMKQFKKEGWDFMAARVLWKSPYSATTPNLKS